MNKTFAPCMSCALLALFFLCFSAALSAQVGESRSVLALGVNGGIGFNKVSFDPTIKQNYHMGPSMGLTLRYTCEKYFKALAPYKLR